MKVEELVSGPRGRRMLLEFARVSERELLPDHTTWQLNWAIADAGYQLDPGRGVSTVRMSLGGTEAEEATPDDVARILANTTLAHVTPDLLIEALGNAVDTARYWQKPDGEDVLAAVPAVQHALRRVADHVLDSQHSFWMSKDFDPTDQWQVHLLHPDVPPEPRRSAADILNEYRVHTIASEASAVAQDLVPITANWSGAWWSIPPSSLQSSSRKVEGTPAGLLFIEDSPGFESAEVCQLAIPESSRVYEVDSANAWAELCRNYPRDVTHEKRHDWYRTTGREGSWVIPDWPSVAADYDGVHLTVAGYLGAAGKAIPVDDSAASVIAGWNPDQTWWLRDMEMVGHDEYWDWTPEEDWSRSPED